VFRGHFRHTIDPKGRLSIPAKFRDVLREGGSDRLVMAPNGTSLDVYPEDKWRELEDRVNGLAKLTRIAAASNTCLSAGSRRARPRPHPDPAGPSRAGALAKNVVIGMMDHFEIWDEDRWSHYQRENAGPLDDLRDAPPRRRLDMRQTAPEPRTARPRKRHDSGQWQGERSRRRAHSKKLPVAAGKSSNTHRPHVPVLRRSDIPLAPRRGVVVDGQSAWVDTEQLLETAGGERLLGIVAIRSLARGVELRRPGGAGARQLPPPAQDRDGRGSGCAAAVL
jgi:MraZ protein